MNNHRDIIKYLKIARAPHLSDKKRRTFLNSGHVDGALAHLNATDIQSLENSITAEMDWLQKNNGFYIFPCDFSQHLQNTNTPPFVLTGIGNKDLLKENIISIVGGRNASFHGRQFVERVSSHLSHMGYVICSGFARGIDTAAHKGANGKTIAVFAGGLNHIYPKENQKLYQDIINDGGLFLSEMPFDCKPLPTLFPRRNRIVAGVCRALIVAEASLKSGSMITARYALDFGRDIYCIPGHPADTRVAGCHQLIQSGAHLFHHVDDIMDNTFHHDGAFNPNSSKKTNEKSQQSQLNFYVPSPNGKPESNDAPKSDDAYQMGQDSQISGIQMSNAPKISQTPRISGAQTSDVTQMSRASEKSGAQMSGPQMIMDHCSQIPISIEDLHHATKISIEILMNTITDLELEGALERTHDGKFIKKYPS